MKQLIINIHFKDMDACKNHKEGLLSMKSMSCPLCACRSLLVTTLSSMINCLVLTSGLAMSTSTSGLLIWLTSPSPVTSGRYLMVQTKCSHTEQPCHHFGQGQQSSIELRRKTSLTAPYRYWGQCGSPSNVASGSWNIKGVKSSIMQMCILSNTRLHSVTKISTMT